MQASPHPGLRLKKAASPSRAPSSYIGQVVAESVYAFFAGVEQPLDEILSQKEYIKEIRQALLNFVFGVVNWSKSRSFELIGVGGRRSFTMSSNLPKSKAQARSPGTFCLHGSVRPLESPLAPDDERDVQLNVNLHGVPALADLEETARRIISTVVAACDETEHAAQCAAISYCLPCWQSDGFFDFSSIRLVPPTNFSLPLDSAKVVHMWLNFHKRRCMSSFPALWHIVSKVSRLGILITDLEGRPGARVVLSHKGLGLEFLARDRAAMWGDLPSAGSDPREMWGTTGLPKWIEFSLEEGFQLPIAIETSLTINAVFGLASLSLPALRFEGVWESCGKGAGSLEVRLKAISSYPRAEKILGMLVSVQRLKRLLAETLFIRCSWQPTHGDESSLPADEPTEGPMPAVEDQLKAERKRIGKKSRSFWPSKLKRVRSRNQQSLLSQQPDDGTPDNHPSSSSSFASRQNSWTFNLNISVRLAAILSSYFASLVKGFLGWALGEWLRFYQCIARCFRVDFSPKVCSDGSRSTTPSTKTSSSNSKGRTDQIHNTNVTDAAVKKKRLHIFLFACFASVLVFFLTRRGGDILFFWLSLVSPVLFLTWTFFLVFFCLPLMASFLLFCYIFVLLLFSYGFI